MKKLALLGLAALVFFGCERRDETQANQNPPANGQTQEQNGRNGTVTNGTNGTRNGNGNGNGIKINGLNGNGINTPKAPNGSVNGGR